MCKCLFITKTDIYANMRDIFISCHTSFIRRDIDNFLETPCPKVCEFSDVKICIIPVKLKNRPQTDIHIHCFFFDLGKAYPFFIADRKILSPDLFAKRRKAYESLLRELQSK